jgi:hypothetical protein
MVVLLSTGYLCIKGDGLYGVMRGDPTKFTANDGSSQIFYRAEAVTPGLTISVQQFVSKPAGPQGSVGCWCNLFGPIGRVCAGTIYNINDFNSCTALYQQEAVFDPASCLALDNGTIPGSGYSQWDGTNLQWVPVNGNVSLPRCDWDAYLP